MIQNEIEKRKNSNFLICENLTRQHYLSLMKYAEFIIGNSSSGLLEAPTLSLPCINLGRRQVGRIKGKKCC